MDDFKKSSTDGWLTQSEWELSWVKLFWILQYFMIDLMELILFIANDVFLINLIKLDLKISEVDFFRWKE